MKKYILSFLLVGSFAVAQNLTIEETVLGPRKYAPTTQTAQQWRKDSKSITYLSTDFSSLVEKSAANGWTASTLATKAEFENALKTKYQMMSLPLERFHFQLIGKP